MDVKRRQSTKPLKTRREFLQDMACATGTITTGLSLPAFSRGPWSGRMVTLFVLADASDRTMSQPPIRWAVAQLRDALQARGLNASLQYNLEDFDDKGERIIVTPTTSSWARQISSRVQVALPTAAESLALVPGSFEGKPVVMATGADVRGLVYAILELADRVTYAGDPVAVLQGVTPMVDQPANSIRSMTRLFVSDVEDKSWFYDKSFWQDYLSMLMTQRFNRFSLTLGLGYDSPKNVLDSYFIFAYPYLVTVPGYEVQVRGLPAGERERNLAMLQYISSEAARRGLHFQLGLWRHNYNCTNSPNVNYLIDGLDKDNHAPYCRDAVRTLLQACPAISGITFRAHYESGIPDGSFGFWGTVFQGVAECGRRVEIDLHAKGISFEQAQMALDTGQPVRVTPKLTAEHQGLPAHQAAMRERERSGNSRNSTARYGYSDYLSEDREYGVYYRIWPGKQKILLWGDPALASGYGRHAGFCGSLGMEVCEPLCFKGRQGTGVSPERRTYADDSLIPEGGDWRKYLYAYRIWGRHLYNPDADPESYRRFLRSEYGGAALAVEEALGFASRVLPLFTSAHLPAGSAMTYWPEMYTDMAIADTNLRHPYGDTPKPKVFQMVSPLDPVMFSPVNEFVDDMIKGRAHARHSPVDVAHWMEGFTAISRQKIALAEKQVPDASDPSFRRLKIDVAVHNGLGQFFANKLRAAVAYDLYQKRGDLDSLRDGIYFYRLARKAWAGIVEQTRGVYVDKLDFGARSSIRGHWADRLPNIDKDLKFMEQIYKDKTGQTTLRLHGPSPAAANWLKIRPATPICEHKVPTRFYPGKPVKIALSADSRQVKNVKLHYRHVNQVEVYVVAPMVVHDGTWRHTIPGAYTDSIFPLMYFFELQDDAGHAWLYPGFAQDLANQPYYTVRRAGF